MLQPPKRSPLLVILISFPLIFITLWQLPKLQVAPLQERMQIITNPEKLADLEKERIVAENNIRTSMIQGIGGILVAITAYVGYLNYRALLEKNAADRFSRAVEQLGNDNIHVRLGGIYALEQIAKDAEEKYYWSVMETLTAYVRRESQSSTISLYGDIPLREDFQATLNVISRRKYFYGDRRELGRLDLSKTNLMHARFPPQASLQGVDFSAANLRGAQLQKVNLREAVLNLTKLMRANLSEAILEGASMKMSMVEDSDLDHADFRNVDMQGAKFRESPFWENIPSYDSNARGLTLSQVEKAKNWQEAELPDYLFQHLPVVEVEAASEQELEQ